MTGSVVDNTVKIDPRWMALMTWGLTLLSAALVGVFVFAWNANADLAVVKNEIANVKQQIDRLEAGAK